jgi:hypothetical protein
MPPKASHTVKQWRAYIAAPACQQQWSFTLIMCSGRTAGVAEFCSSFLIHNIFSSALMQAAIGLR